MDNLDSRHFLLLDFSLRRERNRSYSYRAFARDLGVSVGLISEVLGGKRAISERICKRIAPRLQLSPRERSLFEHSLRRAQHAFALPPPISPPAQISDDQFRVIADWYHFALLNLMKTDDFREDFTWIARRLGIGVHDAEHALARLKRLKLIRRVGGKLRRTVENITTSQDIPSFALKYSHKQTLEQAITSLYETPVSFREITSTTVATSRARMQMAKPIIREFIQSLRDFLEYGEKTEVYNINLQLVPVTKTEDPSFTQ